MKKKSIISLLSVLLSCCYMNSSAQQMGITVSGLNAKSVGIEKLHNARTLKDINPGYPASWVNHYISVELMLTYNGIVTRAMSTNDTLSQEQKKILDEATIGTLIEVKARYGAKNTIQENKEEKLINFSLSVAPAIEAQYQAGHEKLIEYLTSATIDKIEDTTSEQIGLAEVSFTIDKEGKTSNVKVVQTSKVDKVDALLLRALNDMPSWKPAELSDGTKITQEFKLLIGHTIGC